MEKEFNIIIPVIFRDYSFLAKKTLKFVKKNLHPKHIYIITDTRFIHFIPTSVLQDDKCTIIDENALINGLSYANVQETFIRHGCPKGIRYGWYVQQFIKMGFSQSKYCDTDYYLSWDADTIPLREICFFKDDKVCISMKDEYHQPYFDLIKKILGNISINEKSYIAEHMMFSKQIMLELISEIQNADVDGANWIDKIINSTDVSELNSFSEFETYGNYCYNYYKGLYAERQLNTMRRGGLIAGRYVSDKTLEKLAFDMDTISIEFREMPATYPLKIISKVNYKVLSLFEKIIMNFKKTY